MKFIVGQRVRLLREKGEGKITQILDKHTVEVDLGDDFPVEFDIDEIITIDSHENILLPKEEVEKKKQGEDTPLPVRLGIHLMELSLVVNVSGTDHYEIHLANPEKWEILFVCYMRIRSKFEVFAAGRVKSNGGFTNMGRISLDQLAHCREFHFQFLHFTQGAASIPQAPVERNYTWKMEYLQKNAVYSDYLQKDAWFFPLRDKNSVPKPILANVKESDYITLKEPKIEKLAQGVKIVDLHIEKLTSDTRGMGNAEMLFMQIDAYEKALSDALINNHSSLILIHGIGEGKLKSEIIRRLQLNGKVKSFRAADMLRYGNGATEVFFK